MAKYKVEVGGYVSVYRQRTITVYAATEDGAKEKAVEKFMEAQQHDGNMCSEGVVNAVMLES